MDLDFENLTGNSTFNPNTEYYISPYLPTEILTFLVAMTSTFVNALIVYLIAKHKELQTRTYNYMMCWCICNFFVTLSVPNNFNMFGVLEVIPAELLCLWNEVMFVFMFGNQIFVGILIVDWYIMTFSSQTSCAVRCRRSQRVTILTVWIILLVDFVCTVTICLLDVSFPLSALIGFFSYTILFAFLIAVFIVRSVKLKTSSVVVEKTKFELVLVFSYFLCWLPNMLVLMMYIFYRKDDMLVIHFTYILGYGNACVIFLLMYIYDTKFANCVKLMFKKKREEARPQIENEEFFDIIIP